MTVLRKMIELARKNGHTVLIHHIEMENGKHRRRIYLDGCYVCVRTLAQAANS